MDSSCWHIDSDVNKYEDQYRFCIGNHTSFTEDYCDLLFFEADIQNYRRLIVQILARAGIENTQGRKEDVPLSGKGYHK